jgi:hypothetical protein
VLRKTAFAIFFLAFPPLGPESLREFAHHLHRADLAIFKVPLITATLSLHRVARQRLLNELRTKMLKNVLVNEKP